MSDVNTQEDLPEETIIIVGVVCGSIVIILTIVLIVLCCKRQQTKQQYEKQEENHTTAGLGSDPSSESTDGIKPAVKSGLDNPCLDQTDNSSPDFDHSRDGPFVTSASAHAGVPPAYPALYNMSSEMNSRESHPVEQQRAKKIIYEVVV